MCGWIKIHRDIAKHWIFQDAEKFKWWIDLIMMASHEDHRTVVGDSIVVIQRGQMSVSLSFLSSRWGRSKEKVLAFLRLLESDNMIKRVADRKSTTITICNYDSYQDVEMPTPTNLRPISDRIQECRRR
jgi:DNA replication protein DnaD